MDPLTTLSLACNVAQIVDFGLKTISIVRQTYRNGIAHDLADLNVLSVHIDQAASSIRESLSGSKSQGALSRDDSEIRDLAIKSIKISSQLQDKIGSLRSTGGRVNALKRTVKSISSRSTIANLQTALDNYRSALETRILSRLHILLREGLTANIDGFTNLNQDLQDFILRLEQGQCKVAKLLADGTATTEKQITAEHSTTRAAIRDDLTSRELTAANEAKYTKLLNSLRLETLNARVNQLAKAHPKTFEWVFRDDASQPWPDFREWLQSTGSLYWISGKPASGKSTLMKFLSQHQDTQTALAASVPQKQILIVPFFFWKGGYPEQRNIFGFLCSLTYQLLDADDEVLSRVLEVEPRFAKKAATNDWSREELERTLDSATKAIAARWAICFFIDGLDELDENEVWFDLFRFIQQLASVENVKVCVSSRPEPHIRDGLQKYPYLLLQDLNKGDIEAYVRSTLGDDAVASRFAHSGNDVMDRIIYTILEKADGVFLWVVLALKDVLRRLSYRNTWDALLHRLNRLPSDIEELYKDMWRRLNEDHKPFQREASLFFRTFLKLQDNLDYTAQPNNLFLFMATVLEWPQKIHDKPQCFDKMEELDIECSRTKGLIESRCAGILEVTNLPERMLYFQTQSQFPRSKDSNHAHKKLRWTYWHSEVVVIHRTAIDFLLNTEAGREILGHSEISDEQLLVRSVRASLISQLLGLVNTHYQGMEWMLGDILRSNQKLDLLKSMADVSHWCDREVKPARDALLPKDGQRSVYRLTQEVHQQSGMPPLADICNATDFTGLSLEHDIGQYYFDERQLWGNRSQCLTQSYKDYLLLCASFKPSRASCDHQSYLADLLDLGANPVSIHYSPTVFAIRTTPWAMLLLSRFLVELAWEILMFLERGAGFDDRMVIGYMILDSGSFEPVNSTIFSTTPLNAKDSGLPPMLLLEVNALFLIQQAFRDELPLNLKDHPKYLGVTSYARVLLILNEDSDVGFPLNETASDSLVKLIVALRAREGKKRESFYDQYMSPVQEEIQALAEQDSPPIDLRSFLQGRGYYKPPEDPAVWKGPVPRFEEPRDEHGRIIGEEIETTSRESQGAMSDMEREERTDKTVAVR